MLDDLAQRFLPVIVGARVGDAMGTPTEGMSFDEIRKEFGWVNDFSGDGTDDSLMASLLANALVATGGYAGVDEWAAELLRNRDAILAKRDKFFPSVLHTLEKLRRDWSPRRVAVGNMPSTSSAMCIWPVGLVNAGNPRAAAAQAYTLAALIHVNDVDFCQDAAAAVAAAVACGMRPGTNITDAARAALTALHPRSGKLMHVLIADALQMAEHATGYEDFRERYHASYRQTITCDSRETVPAAFALATLADGNMQTAVEYAANFGRDTDTIASIAGALCGGASDGKPLPAPWVDRLGTKAVNTATSLAGQLASAARAKAGEQSKNLRSVPGLLTQGA